MHSAIESIYLILFLIYMFARMLDWCLNWWITLSILQGKRTCCRHGVLLIYVHEEYTYSNIYIDQVASGFEYLCIEISHCIPYSKRHLICNIYRPPGDLIHEFDIFNNKFPAFLNCIAKFNVNSYICGDFNDDLLKINTKRHYNIFFDNIISHSSIPRITLLTRISEQSSTLIDNMLANDIDSMDIAGIIMNNISDQQIIFTYYKDQIVSEKMVKYIHY